jgi:beta-lactamase superfamily II metal-dependent hydrolase
MSLISWPFLYFWGLPLTPGLILGNLLFTPLLVMFLLLSSVLFFLELLSLPHWPTSSLLDIIASLWWYLLSTSSRSWIGIFAHPPAYYVMVIPVITLTILRLLSFSQKVRIVLFSSLFGIAGYLIPQLQGNSTTTLRFFDKELTLLKKGSQGILIDPGIVGRRPSSGKQVTMTLLPQLIKEGVTRLKAVIITKPSQQVFRAAATLVASFTIEKIYLPSFTGSLSNRGWSAWEELVRNAHQNHTKIIPVSQNFTEDLGTRTITVSQGKRVKSNNLVYQPLLTQHISKTPQGASYSQHAQ